MSISGSKDEQKNLGISRKSTLFNLVESAAAADTGTWVDTHNMENGSIEFYQESGIGSISSFSCQVMGSNALLQPENNVDGFNIGAAVTALSGVVVTTRTRWMKVKTTALTLTGVATLGVRMHAIGY